MSVDSTEPTKAEADDPAPPSPTEGHDIDSAALDETTADDAGTGHAEERKRRWRDRDSVRMIRRRTSERHEAWEEWDRRDNEATRLPADEAVHIGGFTLVEAFTPSTVSALDDALEKLPLPDPRKKQERLARLKSSRSAARAVGWESLGVVRPLGAHVFTEGFNDATLPDGIDAVWLNLHYPTPSLTMVAATFTLSEEGGELSALLRRNYQTELHESYIHIPGRFGGLRAKIPWARPKSYRTSGRLHKVRDQKRKACEALVTRYEEECWKWFTNRFQGRFSAEKTVNRPCVRLLFTKMHVPFVGRSAALEPVGLTYFPTIWRSVEARGWALNFDSWHLSEPRRFAALAAARRTDAARKNGPDDGESLWYLTQTFHDSQSPLVVQYAMTCLLSIYADRLRELRDGAGSRRRFSRPIRQARDLDAFLLGDGLDASTISSDIVLLTNDLKRFRWNVPEYSEDQEGYPESARDKREPLELVPVLRDSLSNQATGLVKDMDTAIGNVRASAELRQSIANTRLQRLVIALTIIAIAIAIASLEVSARGS